MTSNVVRATTPFLDLPAELRIAIYSLCFGYEETILPRWAAGQAPRGTAILRTCRRIHAEAWPMFYAQTTIVLKGNDISRPSFPQTMDEHMKNPAGRMAIRELVILDPRIIPYRYPADQLPVRRRKSDWTFDFLRHLPGVRIVSITDVSPIPIHIGPGATERVEKFRAIKHYLELQLAKTLTAFTKDDLKCRPSLAVYATARVVLIQVRYEELPSEANGLELGTTRHYQEVREEHLVKAQLYPSVEASPPDDKAIHTARCMFELETLRSEGGWFPVRCM
jgi:hypothetical protein